MLNLQQGNLFANRYRLQKHLGSGGFSEVWLVTDVVSHVEQVIKIYTGVSKHGHEIFRKEFARVFNLNHSRILKSTSFDIYNECPFLIMPYYPKGSAVSVLGSFNEREIAKLMRDIGGALAYIHQPQYGMIHKDVKPDNIIIDNDGDYLLSDFGISSELRSEMRDYATKRNKITTSGAGITPMAYRAPEYFGSATASQEPIMASDIWSLGATLFEMATGKQPFGQLGGSVQFGNPEPPDMPREYSSSLNNIIKSCLAKDAWARPSAQELRKMADYYLEHNRWSRATIDLGNRGTKVPMSTSTTPQPIFGSGGRPVRPIEKPRRRTVRDNGKSRERTRKRDKIKPFFTWPVVVGLLLIVSGFAYAIHEVFIKEHTHDNSGMMVDSSVGASGNGTIGSASEEDELVDDPDSTTPERQEESKVEKPKKKNKLSSEKEITEITEKIHPDIPNNEPKIYHNNSTYPKIIDNPGVMQSPTTRSAECKLKIKRITLEESQTTVEIGFVNCYQVHLYKPGKGAAFFLAYQGSGGTTKKKPLLDIGGTSGGKNLDIGTRTIKFYFGDVPLEIERMDLIEGTERHAPNRSFWDFKGIDLTKNNN